MNLGYDPVWCGLWSDRRHSPVTDLLHLGPPLTVPQRDQVIGSKQRRRHTQALAWGVPFPAADILVNEEFDAATLRDARCVMRDA